jgi:DNA-binding transcriptional LysR family regulator
MELHHLRVFCLILEHGSISRAARAAALSQPTLSQHLRTLESELSTPLFHRLGRRMVATQAGETFYPYAKQALNLVAEARQALEDHAGLLRGELRIAGSSIPGHYLLPGLLASFHERHPDVRLHLEVGDSQWVVERIQRHEVELGFVGARQQAAGLSFQPFAKDELVLVVPPGHPRSGQTISLNELSSLPLVSREEGSGTRRSWERLLRKGGGRPEDLPVVAQLGSTEAIVRGVKAGMGAAVVSLHAVAEELGRKDLSRVFLASPPLERVFYAVHRESRVLSPAANRFLRFVLESPSNRTGPEAPN